MERNSAFGAERVLPGLLAAHTPEGAVAVDRTAVTAPFSVGRSPDADFSVQDDRVSGKHLLITRNESGFWISDEGSTNGTFLNGYRLYGPKSLRDGDIIRLGESILVFLKDAQSILDPPPVDRFEILGPFHSGPLVRELREASLSFRHILLAGPSGVGKELAARALTAMQGAKGAPVKLISHNCARIAGEDEATSTLFGVGAKVFTGVESRAGLIEHASGGILFLDEVHNLPERVQRSLLRVIEDGIVTRIGETATRAVDVRFVLASNAAAPSFSLAPDLLARLRTVRIPSLKERIADLPYLFDALLEVALRRHGLLESNLGRLLGGDHYEALCLDGFETENIRGLIDLADRLVTRAAAGAPLHQVPATVFAERFGDGKVAERYVADTKEPNSGSHYERNREIITEVFIRHRGNLSAMERALNEQGIKCTRRWLGIFSDKWGLRKSKESNARQDGET